jgi:Plavaka transposase
MLGVIAASDKTPLTISIGNQEMHPVLLSLANIKAGVHMKATSHVFALAAYLPIPKFLNVMPPVQAVLSARVYHICVSTVMDGLKLADMNGAVMSNPNGAQRLCNTPLVLWIGDLPEQRTITCVLSNQSPISEASSSQFSDSDPNPHRTCKLILNHIDQVCLAANLASVPEFTKACEALGLNGVYQPFWHSWGNADPSKFLTPDALHQWHKFSFDHILQWVINIMGGDKLDR